MTTIQKRRLFDFGFRFLCVGAATIASVVLLILIGKILYDGAGRLSLDFLTSPASALFPKKAGIKYAVMGSIWIMVLTVLFTVPIGVGAAIYLEEFADKKSKITSFIEININNLAGVPSIVFGMLGLGIFAGIFGLGKNILVGALTMSILVLPVVIMVSQEAIKAVPKAFREASLAMGATKWDAVRSVVLPNAIPGILTGVILSAARAIGETAPLIVVGAVGLANFAPDSLNSRYTVLPLQILDWITNPRLEFRPVAAAAIIVLVATLMILNSIAIIIRARAHKSL